MTTAKPGGWPEMVNRGAPELMKQVTDLQKKIMADGALSAKHKMLMMMLCDSLLGHNEGAANLAKQARSLGASEAEIAETLAVAFFMGGLPGLVTGANAFRE